MPYLLFIVLGNPVVIIQTVIIEALAGFHGDDLVIERRSIVGELNALKATRKFPIQLCTSSCIV